MVITGNYATPSGTVNFYNGSTFTAANLMGTVTLDATGTATISTSSLAVGTYSIYGGNRAGQSGLALRLRTLHRPWHAAGSLRVHGRRDAGRDFDQRLGIGDGPADRDDPVEDYAMYMPPLTSSVWPVM